MIENEEPLSPPKRVVAFSEQGMALIELQDGTVWAVLCPSIEQVDTLAVGGMFGFRIASLTNGRQDTEELGGVLMVSSDLWAGIARKAKRDLKD